MGFHQPFGKYVIEPKYDQLVYYFSDKYVHAKVRIGGRYIFIDRNVKFAGNTDGEFSLSKTISLVKYVYNAFAVIPGER